MEKLARKLANNITTFHKCDDEEKAVITYGLYAILHTSSTVLLILILGIIIGTPIDILIVCFSASILRKYSGGAHADSSLLCTIISCVYCALAAVISRNLLLTIYHPLPMLVAVILIYGAAFLILYKNAPVDSPNKPINTEKKKKKMRKGSFIVLSVYFIISILLFIFSYKFSYIYSYGISLLFGVSWQVLTLTSIGSILLVRLNYMFYYLFNRKEMKK